MLIGSLPKQLFNAAALLLCLMVVSTQAIAKDWWFEVEIIVFQRDLDPMSIDEDFTHTINSYQNQADFSLIDEYLRPDLSLLINGLPACHPSAEAPKSAVGDVDINVDMPIGLRVGVNAEPITPAPWLQRWDLLTPEVLPVASEMPLFCRFANESTTLLGAVPSAPENFIAKVPVVIDAKQRPAGDKPYLLSAESLQLTKLASDLRRQRGLSRLLHVGWRQEVLFGRLKARSMRLFGGNNFANQFSKNGYRLPPKAPIREIVEIMPTGEATELQTSIEAGLISQIRDALASREALPYSLETAEILQRDLTSVNELWQLDGLFKVFLRYIKGTPYLHIDSTLEYRAPVFSAQAEAAISEQENATDSADSPLQPDRLKSFPFDQLRRVISTQIHYFDHPMFGLVVQIRRHEPGEPQL